MSIWLGCEFCVVGCVLMAIDLTNPFSIFKISTTVESTGEISSGFASFNFLTRISWVSNSRDDPMAVDKNCFLSLEDFLS